MTRPSRLVGALAVWLCCVIRVAGGQTPGQDRVPILAELFTAEGCSSCPPADKILEWLSKAQPVDGVFVVAMSEHVTYWDHQGWKDPFGSPRFTERQQMYARRHGVADIFTPQLVIDGTVQMIGSDTAALKRALADASRRPKPALIIHASLTTHDQVTGSVSGPGLAAGASEGADLIWALTEDDLVVDVRRGENAQRTLHHSAVVRVLREQKIARHPAAPMTVEMPVPSGATRGNLRLVAFVQSPKSKRVVSVGSTRVLGVPPPSRQLVSVPVRRLDHLGDAADSPAAVQRGRDSGVPAQGRVDGSAGVCHRDVAPHRWPPADGRGLRGAAGRLRHRLYSGGLSRRAFATAIGGRGRGQVVNRERDRGEE